MRTYTDQEYWDAEDANYVSTRIVNTYASASARSTGIPTPIAGQLAWVTGVGLTLYDGTAWRVLTALPAGGTTGQLLAKTSGTDYAVGWVDPPA